MSSPVAAGGAALAISMMRARGYAPSPATIEGLLSVTAKISPALRSKIQFGRVLNIRRLKEFIEATYPVRDAATDGPIDPTVPGYKPCL